jgi:L-lysine exporter family protein LysE/ArgO
VSPLLFGMLFGLATALPIGAQSFVVMNQGLRRVGYPRVLVGIATASLCDTLLIVLGVAGVSALLVALANERLLISIGALFFIVIGMTTLCSSPEETEVKSRTRVGAMIVQTVGVSLLNPHAAFETVGLLGGAIAV